MSTTVGPPTPSMSGRPRTQPVNQIIIILIFIENIRNMLVKGSTPVGGSSAANEGALANFFNSLLTRKSGVPATPTTASTPVAQRQSKLLTHKHASTASICKKKYETIHEFLLSE